MAFTDINPVIDTVHSTGVHLTEDPNVEFALAVHNMTEFRAIDIILFVVFIGLVFQ